MTTLNRIIFTQDTFLKQEPIQSSQLPNNKLQSIPLGTLLVLKSIESSNPNHYKVTFKNVQFKNLTTNWYAFAEHVRIIQEPLIPVQTVDEIAAKQLEKNAVKIFVDQQSIGNQQGFLKLVFNVDTIIKRSTVEARLLNEQSKQIIPAGTELVLLTNKPDANNQVKFTLIDNHLKFSLKNVELKGFSRDWYVSDKHVGIQLID